MTDAIIEFFRNLLNNDILTIIIISMIPIIELRGSIPVAIQMGLEWYEALGYAFIGSMIVVPFLLLLLMPILNLMKKWKFFRSIANAVEDMFRSKAESITKKLGKGDSRKREEMIKMLGVLAFVAIPLPMTGVWTGSAVALFVGLSFPKSLLVIALGDMSAGLIMTGLSVLLKEHLNLFLTVFMIVVLVVLIANIVYLVIKKKMKKKRALESENISLEVTQESSNTEEQNIQDNVIIKSESIHKSSESEENKSLNSSIDTINDKNIKVIKSNNVKSECNENNKKNE